jgi:PadR family transcriptional regulator PadR
MVESTTNSPSKAMSDRHYCRVCKRWIGGGVGHNISEHPAQQNNSPTSAWAGLTAFQRDLLIVIASGTTVGERIKDELEDYYEGGIRDGRLYPNLDTLRDKDMIFRSGSSPRLKEYMLTEKGGEVMEAGLEWRKKKTPNEL